RSPLARSPLARSFGAGRRSYRFSFGRDRSGPSGHSQGMRLVSCSACARPIRRGDRCPHCGATPRLPLAAGVLFLRVFVGGCVADAEPAYGIASDGDPTTGMVATDTDTDTTSSTGEPTSDSSSGESSSGSSGGSSSGGDTDTDTDGGSSSSSSG